jgi:plastocyanin
MRTFRLAAFGTAWLLIARLVPAAEVHALIKDQHGKPVADAVVTAVEVDPKNAPHPALPTETVDQVDKQFVPYVKAIYVGSKIRFPNKDNIQHQVYSFSPAKKFELPLYAGTEALPVSFDKTGVVVLGCNIHDWMIGYIYVADTPFFAKTASSGTAALKDLPAGQYLLKVWHPSMERAEGSTQKTVTVAAGDVADLEWQLAVRPTIRIPRVSGEVGGGYR